MLQQTEHFVLALWESKAVLSMLFLAFLNVFHLYIGLTGPHQWGNEEEKGEVCMCVMCVTAAGLVHRATVPRYAAPANKPSTVISRYMWRLLFDLLCINA